MVRLAQSFWGLEAGLLWSTHAALLTTLVSYGLAVVGSGAYARELGRTGTLDVNVSTRRITGISRYARLETIHMTAGLWSIHNLYRQHVSWLLVRILSAMECSITVRLGDWLRSAYGVSEGFSPDQRSFAPRGLRPWTCVSGL